MFNFHECFSQILLRCRQPRPVSLTDGAADKANKQISRTEKCEQDLDSMLAGARQQVTASLKSSSNDGKNVSSLLPELQACPGLAWTITTLFRNKFVDDIGQRFVVYNAPLDTLHAISAEIFTAAYLWQTPLISAKASRKAHCQHLWLGKWAGGSKGMSCSLSVLFVCVRCKTMFVETSSSSPAFEQREHTILSNSRKSRPLTFWGNFAFKDWHGNVGLGLCLMTYTKATPPSQTQQNTPRSTLTYTHTS